MKDTDKVLGNNLTTVTHEPPVQASSGNISFIGKIVFNQKN